ncbi:MAG: rhamnose/proton symporter RhaT [Planctomycetota bacterium]|nr:MAG: rhamnose/proton symporter RhaT [Planctomycetota bacterium]
MLVGVMWAIVAGIMLGLYALPGKFTKDFKFENTWGLFFLLTMFVVPIVATAILMQGIGDVYSNFPQWKLAVMCVASLAWGLGVMMWGKAITHIGMSLGFSLFIGTVILVGSLLPLVINVMEKGAAGLPAGPALAATAAGIIVVLLGIICNGKAGLTREKDEAAAKEAEAAESTEEESKKASMALGIFIAVFGGLLATGFSVANTIAKPELPELTAAAGNPDWVAALAIMLPIFLSGGVIMTVYFVWQLSAKKAWGGFKTPYFPVNFVLIFIMAFFHYAASAVFAYAAYRLGDRLGDTVGYAIFNTTCVGVAVLSGLATGEWKKASSAAKTWLFAGLACMILGILCLAGANALNKSAAPAPAEETAAVSQTAPVDVELVSAQ